MELYTEVSEGLHRKTPPEMIKTSDLFKWQGEHQNSSQGLFASVFEYPTDDPYIGGIISPLYMDFDNKENPDRARREAIAVVKKLITEYDVPEGNICIAFSGMKGISLTIDYEIFGAEVSAYLPMIWKSLVQQLVSELNLKTIDLAIYERRRLWRILNSKHQKSGLYKIPLTFPELENLNIGKIKELAKQPRSLLTKPDAKPVEKAVRLFQKHKVIAESWLIERKASFKRAELNTMEDDPPCIKRRLEIGAEPGHRNSFLFQIAVYYAHTGLKESEILGIAQRFTERCKGEPPLMEGEIESVVHSAFKGVEEGRYNVGCSSEALADLCDREKCPFFSKPEEVEPKTSCGADLGDYAFEQVGNRYIVFDKTEMRVLGLEDTFRGFKPLKPCLLTTPSNCEPFEDVTTLWNEIRQFIYEYVDLREEHDYDILTAWTLATWTPELWDVAPYVFFFGPAGSGKTWAMEVLKQLTYRSLMAASATPATLYYACQDWKPTLFLDETEIYTRDAKAEVINILNSGYRKGQYAMRVGEPDRKTGARQILTFEVFGFKALAGTSEFVQTLKSRCIVINMAKAVRKIRSKIDIEKAKALRNKLLMYRFVKLAKKDNEPLPEELHLDGRLRELFEPLILVAPKQERLKMIAIAEKMQNIQREEEELSIEAIVFRATVKAYHSFGKEGKVAIQDVTNIVNTGLSFRDQVEPTTVGYITSRLGFRKVRYRNQRCIVWDENLVERLAQRYPIGDLESIEEVEVSKPQTKKDWLLDYMKDNKK
jgi:hypothetical protein